MSIIRQLIELKMKLFGATKLDIELYRVSRNIKIDKDKLDEMYDRWKDEEAPCCPNCMFGYKYTKLQDKQERRRIIEQMLVNKIKIRDKK